MVAGKFVYYVSVLGIISGSWVKISVDGKKPIMIDGLTMGTSYHVTYFDERSRNLKPSIDSLLVVVNKSINTYDARSEVSLFNKSTKGIAFGLPDLKAIVKKSYEFAIESEGSFDPTVMPFVDAWGFGKNKNMKLPSSTQIDSIKSFVGYQKIKLNDDSLTKADSRVQLDFGGIGQGYGVDVIADFLRSKGVENFLIELGGEGITAGKNLLKNKAWQIGILDPNSALDHQFLKAYITLTDRAFTTSGNYFNYREINGKKYGHTIDPKTGYPVQHELLSVSVFASDCTTADAWDTAFMVMGLAKTLHVLKQHPELDAILIFSGTNGNTDTYITPGIKNQVTFEE